VRCSALDWAKISYPRVGLCSSGCTNGPTTLHPDRPKAYVRRSIAAYNARDHAVALTEAGKNSPFRDRNVEENARFCFRRACARSEFSQWRAVAARQIDMSSGNITCAIRALSHPARRGIRAREEMVDLPELRFRPRPVGCHRGRTHSICTLEIRGPRAHDWFGNLPVPSRPHQYEFARLNLTYTICRSACSRSWVRGGHVSGWDDPACRPRRLRRLRVRPASSDSANFVKRWGVAKARASSTWRMLNFFRSRASQWSPAMDRAAAAQDRDRELSGRAGNGGARGRQPSRRSIRRTRRIRSSAGALYRARGLFMENPPKKFFVCRRRRVRLRYAYFITCREAVKNASGEVIEHAAATTPRHQGRQPADAARLRPRCIGYRRRCFSAEVRLYNPLFAKPDPNAAAFAADLNPSPLEMLPDAKLEPASPPTISRSRHSSNGRVISSATRIDTRQTGIQSHGGLRDTWAKVAGGGANQFCTGRP